jgi:hypothetical protein
MDVRLSMECENRRLRAARTDRRRVGVEKKKSLGGAGETARPLDGNPEGWGGIFTPRPGTTSG